MSQNRAHVNQKIKPAQQTSRTEKKFFFIFFQKLFAGSKKFQK
jgi:hypothetical protein